jgi:hypothetical protein
MLRVSLSARPERLETCRRLSEAELAERPAHMRQTIECQGVNATYRLRISSDGVALAERVLRGSGFRHDRPIHFLHEFPFKPGGHRLKVELIRIESASVDSTPADQRDTGLTLDRDAREVDERVRRRLEAIPAQVSLDTNVVFAPGQVVVVTWDPVTRVLQLVGAPFSTGPTSGGDS